MSYRTLNPDRIVETLEQLTARIEERFPGAGLGRVSGGLTDVARLTKERAAQLEKPNLWLRIGSISVIVIGLLVIGYVASIIEYKRDTDNFFGVLQGIEALINVVVASGIAIFFLTTIESRWKQHRALEHLHELRTIVHVIDMHQLTKDPSASGRSAQQTPSSPKRIMTPYELLRYLEYCSEMLSLSAKVATLYAQSSRDTVVISAVTEVEQVSANLSYKIWQKITLIDAADLAADLAADVAGDIKPAGPSLTSG